MASDPGTRKAAVAEQPTRNESPKPEENPSEPPTAGPFSGVKAPLILLSAIATVAMLRWAQSVLIPLALGILISYALSPLVVWMSRIRVPRWISAGILLSLLVIGLGAISYKVGAEGASAAAKLPESIDKVRESLKEFASGGSLIANFRKSAKELEEAAAEATGEKPSKGKAGEKPPIKVEQPTINIHQFLWMGSSSAIYWIEQVILNLFLVYFLLSSGDLFKRKLVKIAGNTFAAKRITVQILDEINFQIQRYLLVQLFISVIVWLLCWVAFEIIGLENAAFWGVLAGTLHTNPFIGSALIIAGAGMVGFFQFGTFEMGLLLMGVSAVIVGVAGMMIMPWLTGRAVRMNAGALFITLVLWSWIWGIWGLLLGTPVTMAFKTVCDHIEGLESIGELLGE